MIPDAQPLTTRLEGSIVVLEPLAAEHAEELWEAAQAPRSGPGWPTSAQPRALRPLAGADPRSRARRAPRARSRPAGAPQRRASSAAAATSTCGPPDRVVEIGWTWLNPSAWRTGANVEAKLLMLEHAFETLGCVRVEFKTDARNERSRAALAALPAQFEGVLRNHMIVPDVGQRDSAYLQRDRRRVAGGAREPAPPPRRAAG